MTLTALLDSLEATDSATPLSFPALLERLYHLRYQGEITLHFAGGVPRAVEFSQPVQLPLNVPRLTKGGQ